MLPISWQCLLWTRFGQGLLSLKTIYLLSVPDGVATHANQLQVKKAFIYAHYTIQFRGQKNIPREVRFQP